MGVTAKRLGPVRAALLNWLGVPISTTSTAFWQEWFRSGSASGKAVTVDTALQLSTVWACVRLLSETVSTLPLRLYRRRPDGSRVPATDHPLYRLLAISPNREMTPARFLLQVVASLSLRGNAYVEKKRIGRRVVALVPLVPQCMAVRRLDNGRLQYEYTEGGAKRILSDDDVMHIRGFGLDGALGLMPVHSGAEVMGAAMAAEEAAAKIFAQGMQASGFLTHEAGALTPKQREELRTSLAAFAGSKNAGKVMVLEAGLKYQGITMNPEAAQLLETRGYNVEEICRWFRVPPFMVGHMDKQSSWASSVEGQNLHFLTNTLRPLLENMEQEITRCLLDPVEAQTHFPKFIVEGLLRADSAGRAAYYNSALQNGWTNRNEVRALEDLPPIEGGDVFTVQSNLLPLDKLGIQYEAPPNDQAQSA